MVIDLNTNKVITIGTINFSDSFNEDALVTDQSRKPNLSGIGLCNVVVNPKEGPIPHIHIIKTDKSWGACICLHDALYFPHGDDNLTKGTFSSKQAKEFNKWMSSKSSKNESHTNYSYAAFIWMRDYGKLYGRMYEANGISLASQPNYSHMRGDVNPNLR